MFERIPLKGPILIYAALAVGLAGIAHVASRQMGRLLGVKDAASGALTVAELEQSALAPFLPLAGSDPSVVTEALAEGAPADGVSDADGADGADDGRRPPGWTYPAFAPGDDRDGRHNALSSIGAAPPHGRGPSPRNVIVHLCDDLGAPLLVDVVSIEQTGADGRATPNAYRFTEDGARWTIGSPALTPGAGARFTVRAYTDVGAWCGSAEVPSISATGDIDLGEVRCVLTRGDGE